jgi:hypothetical protein
MIAMSPLKNRARPRWILNDPPMSVELPSPPGRRCRQADEGIKYHSTHDQIVAPLPHQIEVIPHYSKT